MNHHIDEIQFTHNDEIQFHISNITQNMFIYLLHELVLQLLLL